MEKDESAEKEVIKRLESLNHSTVRWLGTIILVSVVSIALLALVNATTPSFGLQVSPDDPNLAASRGGQADQAIAILGNLAAAGIGGLVGWITRDFTLRYRDIDVSAPGK